VRGKNHGPPDPPSRPQMRDRDDLLGWLVADYACNPAFSRVMDAFG